MGAAVAASHAQVDEELGDRLGGHGAATIRVRAAWRSAVAGDGLRDEHLGQFRRLGRGDEPAGHLGSEDVNDGILLIELMATRAGELVRSHDHTSLGALASSWGMVRAGWVRWRRRSRLSPEARSSRYIVEIDARYVPSSNSRAHT